MNLHNLSIFSSKSPPKNPILDSVKTGLWFIGFLVLFDIAVNLLFPYPANPRAKPGKLNLYFDYGRSIEGKIRRQVGATDESTALLALAGWLDSENWSENHPGQPVRPDPGEELLIATYGMSFSNQVSRAMETINPNITLRLIAGPAAPPNHSFAAYQLDRGHHEADVVILGVLASSVKGLSAISGMTWGAEVPAAFTFPKYGMENGELKAIEPKIQSIEQLRVAVKDEEKWQAFVDQMRNHDRFFNSFLFEENWTDYSAIIRMIRRSWGQKHQVGLTNEIHTSAGFNQDLPDIQVLPVMVQEFAETAQADGKLPIVLLFNDRGYDDHLFEYLQPTLEANSIPFVSTHRIAPATDLKNFKGDGHFTKHANQLIAQEVLEIIEQHFPSGGQSENRVK